MMHEDLEDRLKGDAQPWVRQELDYRFACGPSRSFCDLRHDRIPTVRKLCRRRGHKGIPTFCIGCYHAICELASSFAEETGPKWMRRVKHIVGALWHQRAHLTRRTRACPDRAPAYCGVRIYCNGNHHGWETAAWLFAIPWLLRALKTGHSGRVMAVDEPLRKGLAQQRRKATCIPMRNSPTHVQLELIHIMSLCMIACGSTHV